MVGKRKRKRPNRDPDHVESKHRKRQKLPGNPKLKDTVVKEAILGQYYIRVLSLREYLISKLPPTSKTRRKKILSYGKDGQSSRRDGDEEFSKFLDETIIGVRNYEGISPQERSQQWASFSSQRHDTSESTLANLTGIGTFSQSEIVDFAIWLMFQKSTGVTSKAQHLLCQGYRKNLAHRALQHDEGLFCDIAGLVSTYPNSHVEAMKELPWPRVVTALGKEGERIMIDLILDCGIFLNVESGHGTYNQLSGYPLGDLVTLGESSITKKPIQKEAGELGAKFKVLHTPASIVFVRNRMLYARAALNARGGVRFGFRHIHVLNRYKYTSPGEDDIKDLEKRTSPHESTLRILMYVFPRQFGLHNVFTSEVNTRETVQAFKDYTLREDEIIVKFPDQSRIKVPKRLRGRATQLAQKLQLLHKRCAYKELLEYYCPVTKVELPLPNVDSQGNTSTAFGTQLPVRTISTTGSVANIDSLQLKQAPMLSLMSHATPFSMVAAFCQAVLKGLIPHDLWGIGDDGVQNQAVFHRNVNRFIELRRFENLSLHEVLQGLKINQIEWLGPSDDGDKFSRTETEKRREIFYEFIYYLFDSILIPLIRANFHVTESNIHRYRLFYFRHDVWRTIAEPALSALKLNTFEEVKLYKAQKILGSRILGYSQVRLLPKETGVRPIMNLRRRTLQKGFKNLLGASINSVLAPIYNAFTYEKTLNPDRFGSTLFSVGDLYKKLKVFKDTLLDSSAPLYFVKVDVKAAFDNIPQIAVLDLMKTLPTVSKYHICKHVEIKPGEGYRENFIKPMRKWTALAKGSRDKRSFHDALEGQIAVGRKNTIFVENTAQSTRETEELMTLLTEHVKNNMVKIGKKFYRQKEGIPQGSVLSSLLCNFFYADFEAKHLHFLDRKTSLLLRLIDDFLLITAEDMHAKRFLQVMYDGVPAYGVQVNPDKTLVNFEATINEKKVPRLLGSKFFPYCGSFISIKTLDITKDRERKKDMDIADSLTVEFTKMPGRSFYRKVLNTFKIQAHAMFLDTSHNSLVTVLSNIYNAFHESATKMWMYARCMPTSKQPNTKLLIKTFEGLIELAFVLLKSKGRNKWGAGYACAVSKVQVEWLALNAFTNVLQVRQSKYTQLLVWMEERIMQLNIKDAACQRLKGTVSAQPDKD